VTLEIRPAVRRRERRLFRNLPALLHESDACFVPTLDATFARLHDRRRNPYWRAAEAGEWLAWRAGRPVGRIGACLDRALQEREPDCGVVGFFDCVDDPEAAGRLFEAAYTWLRERGCTRALGPLNYSIHDTAGLLVDGFSTPPTIDTTWNPPHHARLWEAHGWRGIQDLLACAGDLPREAPASAVRFGERARSRGISVRPLDLSDFGAEVDRVREVYNRAWDANWGHVPIGREEFLYKARDLKAVLDPDVVRLAEHEGRPVGFLLGLPDLNPAIRRSGGRLLPFGWWRILRAGRRERRLRLIALGVVEGHRNRGVEALMLAEGFRASAGRYRWCEASWVLADNKALLNGLELYNLRPYKRWRLYSRDLP
jgi:GNAT superfamily N-acetyltransferase